MPSVRDKAIVVIVSGIPGAGKTALAEKLAEQLPARLLSRDIVRASMFMPCSFSDIEKQASFRAVLEALDANCRLGIPTVVEGMPFSRDQELEAVRELAARYDFMSLVFHLDLPVEVAQARVTAQRSANVPMADDRSPALVADVARRFRKLPADVHVLDATRPAAELLLEVHDHVRSARTTK